MRIALTVFLLVLLPTAQAAHESFLVGPGGEQRPDFAAYGSRLADQESTSATEYAMAPTLEGSLDTSFREVGLWNPDVPHLETIPTFSRSFETPLALDGARPLVLHIWQEKADLGCGNLAQLFDQDGNLLGPEGGLDADGAPGGPGEPTEVTFTFEGVAGNYTGLLVQVAQSFSDCGNGTVWWWGSDAHPAYLDLGVPHEAVVPAGQDDGPVHVTLQAREASIHHQWEGKTATFVHNWTQDLGSVNVTYNATVEAGSVDVTVLDGDGAVAFERTFDADDAGNHSFGAVDAGNWTIRLTYQDFTGSLRLGFTEAATSASAPPGPDGEANGTAQGGARGEADAPGADSPGPAPLLVLGLLAAVAVVRRRR